MSKMNVEPLTTLLDGSQLLVSTQYLGEGRFKCQLYVSLQDNGDPRAVQGYDLEAPTCREAQDIAYGRAMSLYPGTAGGIRKPPYLIWQGPTPAIESIAPALASKRWRRRGVR